MTLAVGQRSPAPSLPSVNRHKQMSTPVVVEFKVLVLFFKPLQYFFEIHFTTCITVPVPQTVGEIPLNNVFGK